MIKILNCRRTFLAALGIICLTYLGVSGSAEVAASIATICLGVAGANAWQNRKV